MLKHRPPTFDAAITPTKCYASGTWAPIKEHERMIQSAQRKMLRLIIETKRRYKKIVKHKVKTREDLHNIDSSCTDDESEDEKSYVSHNDQRRWRVIRDWQWWRDWRCRDRRRGLGRIHRKEHQWSHGKDELTADFAPSTPAACQDSDGPSMWNDEDGNTWWQSSSGRWCLLGSDCTVWWDAPGWRGGLVVLSVLGSIFARRCATTGATVCVRLNWVTMRQYTEAVGRISGLHVRVARNLEHYLVQASYLDSYLFSVWVLPCGVQCIEFLGR